jgi:hypothetical protein
MFLHLFAALAEAFATFAVKDFCSDLQQSQTLYRKGRQGLRQGR